MKIGRDSYAIPFNDVRQAVEALEYATEVRVILIMLALTGCRIRALEKMRPDRVFESEMFYRPCKSQHGWIKEPLPEWYIQELGEYRRQNKVSAYELFGISSETFRRYFNRYRKILPQAWQEKILIPHENTFKIEYQHELKGLRKNYQTLDFARNMQKWGNPEIALQFTSKHMKHSSTRITAHHYIQNFESLGIRGDLINVPETTLPRSGQQARLLDYGG